MRRILKRHNGRMVHVNHNLRESHSYSLHCVPCVSAGIFRQNSRGHKMLELQAWTEKQQNRVSSHEGRIKALLAKRADETLTFRVNRMDSEIAFLNAKIVEIQGTPYPYQAVNDEVLERLKADRKASDEKTKEIRKAIKARRLELKG